MADPRFNPNERFWPVSDRLSREELRRMIGRMNFSLQHWKNRALDRHSLGNREPDIEVNDDLTPAGIAWHRSWSFNLSDEEKMALCGDMVRLVAATRAAAAKASVPVPNEIRYIDMPPTVRDALLAYHARPCDREAADVVRAVLANFGPPPAAAEAAACWHPRSEGSQR